MTTMTPEAIAYLAAADAYRAALREYHAAARFSRKVKTTDSRRATREANAKVVLTLAAMNAANTAAFGARPAGPALRLRLY